MSIKNKFIDMNFNDIILVRAYIINTFIKFLKC